MVDFEKIRKDFPMLSGKKMRGHDLVYLDSASTSLKPQAVIDAMMSYYSDFTANSHRGDYDLCFELDNKIARVRSKVAHFINADEDEIVFTYGTTSSISLIALGYGFPNFKKGDEIIINEAEHASNTLPWFELSKKIGIKVVFAPLDEKGEVTLEAIKSVTTPNTKLISIAAATNVLGTMPEIKNIANFAQKRGILLSIDGAQYVPHHKIDVKDLGCDFLSFSGHKMLGPTGIGVLFAKEDLLKKMSPVDTGGGNNVTFKSSCEVTYLPAPAKFESGTLNIDGILGLGACIDYLEGIGMDEIAKHEAELKKYAVSEMSKIPDVIIYNKDNESGIVTFNIDGVFAQDVATYLNNKGIAVRSGLHCAKMLNGHIGADATVRASFYVYTNKHDIDALCEALKTCKGGFLDVYFN